MKIEVTKKMKYKKIAIDEKKINFVGFFLWAEEWLGGELCGENELKKLKKLVKKNEKTGEKI